MKLCEAAEHGRHFIWDADRIGAPDDALFDVDWWRDRQAITDEATGRGAAYVIDGLDDSAWVLRHGRRGGMLARLNHDRFLWTGAERARPLEELRLLAEMHERKLPVPAPVAARAVRAGPVYRADLITECIAHSQTLADRLQAEPMNARAWQSLGGTLARFHRAGIWHADLNARNVLIDSGGDFYLIDFDKARQRAVGRWREANLARLRRSLDKFCHANPEFNFLEADWVALRGGYAAGFAEGV